MVTVIFVLHTEPPTAPLSLKMDIGSTAISLMWLPSTETGGRSDLYYKVEYSDPDNIGKYFASYTISTSYTIIGLRPYTMYCIQVSAHNGVSDQVPDRSASSMIEECTRTHEGSKPQAIVHYIVHPVLLLLYLYKVIQY